MQPIKLNSEVKEMLINRFKEKLNKTEFGDNSIDFSIHFNEFVDKSNLPRPKIFISATAYLKMMLYVRDTSTEIAWHGIVERFPEQHTYYIKDVMLYPQKLSSATVQTDQDKYNKWMEELDDDTYNHLRFQGHSHVNFSVSPSGTDLRYYNDILQVLPNNDYYIFMILNKSGDTTFLLCDLATNLIYDTEDIDVYIRTADSNNTIGDISKAKEEYCETPRYNFEKHYNYEDYYKKKFDEDLNRDLITPSTDSTEVDKLYDDLDSKYKRFRNPKLGAPKVICKKKVKGEK
jgi:hypothetical protein